MRQHFLLAAAVAFAAGCSDDSTGIDGTITAEMRADVAAATGEALAGDVEAMSRTSATASSSMFAFAGNPSAAGCTFNLGTFVCLNTLGNLDGEATVTFRDANDDAQDGYDATTTASVLIETDVSGTVSRGNFQVEYARMADFTVTGLAGDETSRTWNGTASMSVSSSLFNGNRGYEMDAATTFNAVVVAATGGEPRWPTSGSATTTVNFTVTGGPHAGESGTVTATVTFNGTGQVPLRVGNADFTLNLQTHAVAEAN